MSTNKQTHTTPKQINIKKLKQNEQTKSRTNAFVFYQIFDKDVGVV